MSSDPKYKILEKLLEMFDEPSKKEYAGGESTEVIELMQTKMMLIGLFESMKNFCEASKIQTTYINDLDQQYNVLVAYANGLFNSLVILERFLSLFEEQLKNKKEHSAEETEKEYSCKSSASGSSEQGTMPSTSNIKKSN
jgi:hypothetical protein